MDRLINRRQQGDLGEASAIEWLTRQGARISIPFGFSPDYDLVADFDGHMLRVQVKTTTHQKGNVFNTMIATNGGNQSWTGVTKYFDAARCDALFVLAGDGRRWFIPSHAVEGRRGINLGGPKYSEFEVEAGAEITELVYGPASPELDSSAPGEYPSGQRMHTVNVPAYAFAGSNPASPIAPAPSADGCAQTTKIWGKRRVTLPRAPFAAAGLAVGDRLRAEAAGDGSILLRRIVPPQQQVLGDG